MVHLPFSEVDGEGERLDRRWCRPQETKAG